MDSWGGHIDPYFKTKFAGKTIKTDVVKYNASSHECFFDQEFWLPVQVPLSSDRF